MLRLPRTCVGVAALATVAALTSMTGGAAGAVSVGTARTAQTDVPHPARSTWAAAGRRGSVRLLDQVPISARPGRGGTRATVVGAHEGDLSLNFSLPLHDTAGLDALIATEARTHHYLSHAQVAARFAPPQAQVDALTSWIDGVGLHVTHVDAGRTAVAASGSVATVESALGTHVQDFVHRGYTSHSGVEVAPYGFFANTVAPRLPARLGVTAVSGLSDVDRFFSDVQLAQAAPAAPANTGGGGPQATHARTGVGYYPSDLTSMYDVAGHGLDATGQTLGFTLWGAGETQQAMTAFSTATGDQAITVDPACTATGNSPTRASTCTTAQAPADHLVSILENGNTNGSADPTYEYGANIETALDIEQAHGMATGAGMKYYLSNCTAAPPAGSGLSNGTCNGTDTGMEEAVEDAASDPTLHTVSNSWGYGGDVEWGRQDPFRLATTSSFQLAAAAGTTFWFSTGDSGSYESGYPADSPYVVGVGGTSLFSTASLTPADSGTTVRSTATAWAAGGSWCSSIEARPSWQNGPAVAAKAPCPGRVVPDVSAIADSSTSVLVAATETAVGGVGVPITVPVGGTSVAAPEMNGMAAMTQAFLAKQTYAGAAPAAGFEGPMFYQLGNGPHAADYFHDVTCGNTASPAGGPDGDASDAGWDPATGFGEIDWFHWATGYAMALGATGLTEPASLDPGYAYGCAPTPTNAAERGLSFPTTDVGYAVGSPSGATPWPATFLAAGSYGAVNSFLKTTDGGASWQTTNSDMLGVACPTSTTCVEVGDGGRIRRTTDSGATWTYVESHATKALTSVACPSATTCYADGDRGAVLKSSDAGATWAFASSADGNVLYGLSCPSVTVCYGVDGYAHVEKTTDGGATFTLMSTPVTTPGVDVPGSGGPNPFAGLYAITCTSVTACVAVGGYPPTGTDSPIVTTTDGGATWTLRTSNSGAGNTLNGVSCVSGTCYAVGAAGAIVTSADGGATWTAMTSGTTGQLIGIACTGVGACVATGQAGVVDVLTGTTWTATEAQAGGNFLTAVRCASATSCLAVGKQGVTLAFDPTAVVSSAELEAGGGTVNAMNGVSCVDATHCASVGAAGTILTTSDAGQTYLTRTSGTTAALAGVSCVAQHCEAVGGSTAAGAVAVGSTDGGATWTTQTTGAQSALTGVSCTTATSCVAVGGQGTIISTTDGGTTWTTQTSGTIANLAGVSCVTATPVAPTGAVAATTCYAVGAVGTGATTATIVASTDGGTTWAAQTSNSPQALTTVTCANRFGCFAGGALGTVVTTSDGGTTWAQQGNPLSGPTTALNPGPAALIAVFGSACSSARCALGTASAGDVMTTPTLTVTVTAGGKQGVAPVLAGLAPGDPAISYSPATEAGHVTGTLTCTTTATATSSDGAYPVAGCTGLVDPGYSVVYDDDASSYTVGLSPQRITFGPIADKTYGDKPFAAGATASSGLPVSYTAAGACTVSAAGVVTLTGAGTCTITAAQAGSADYRPATSVSQTFAVAKAPTTLVVAIQRHATAGPTQVAAVVRSAAPHPSGSVRLTVGSKTCTAPLTASGGASCRLQVPAGARTVTGSYAGGGDYLPSRATSRSTVAKAKPGLVVSARAVKRGKRHLLAVTVKVLRTRGFAASGKARVMIVHGHSCTATIRRSTGTCTVPANSSRSHALRITYSGDRNHTAVTRKLTVRTRR